MSATSSHLRLEGYFLKELQYSINNEMEQFPEKIGNLEPPNLEVSDSTRLLDEASHRWRCELLIQTKDDYVYDFKIVMVGFFTVNAELESKTQKLIAESNCPAVLYSAAREIVATVTRRSPYPGTVLPLVTFIKPPEKTSDGQSDEPETSTKKIKKGSQAEKKPV